MKTPIVPIEKFQEIKLRIDEAVKSFAEFGKVIDERFSKLPAWMFFKELGRASKRKEMYERRYQRRKK